MHTYDEGIAVCRDKRNGADLGCRVNERFLTGLVKDLRMLEEVKQSLAAE